MSFLADISNIRLDHFLAEKLPEYSRSKIQQFINSGQVIINGAVTKPSFILRGDEELECNLKPIESDLQIKAEAMELDVLYEDEQIAIINKPAGLVVHPGSGNWTGTLLNGLLHQFKTLSRSESLRPGIIHRLDKDTSGVIIIAKSDKVHKNLGEQFAKRTVKKNYMALAWGKIEKAGKIAGQIDRNPRNRQAFTIVKSGGRDSLTSYEPLGYYSPLSFLSLWPKTGRTHQLRVHLNSISHPIFRDELYGGGINRAKSYHVRYTQLLNRLNKKIKRFALHAHSLEIKHPETGKKMVFTAPIPNDMETVLDILKNENE